MDVFVKMTKRKGGALNIIKWFGSRNVFIFCLEGFAEYFAIGDSTEVTMEFSTHRPRGEDYYELTELPGDDDIWIMADTVDEDSPWQSPLDRWLTRKFKHKKVYVTCWLT